MHVKCQEKTPSFIPCEVNVPDFFSKCFSKDVCTEQASDRECIVMVANLYWSTSIDRKCCSINVDLPVPSNQVHMKVSKRHQQGKLFVIFHAALMQPLHRFNLVTCNSRAFKRVYLWWIVRLWHYDLDSACTCTPTINCSMQRFLTRKWSNSHRCYQQAWRCACLTSRSSGCVEFEWFQLTRRTAEP